MTVLNIEKIGVSSPNPPLFVIHTIPLDHSYFKSSLNELQLSDEIVLLDLPSHGLSDDVDDEMLEFEHMATMIEKLRIELNLEKISLLGHGVGGFVALCYLLEFGSTLDKLVLVNTAGDSRYRKAMAWNIRDQYSKVTRQALNEYYGKTDDESIRVRLTQAFSTYFHPIDHEGAKKLMDSANRIATRAYVHMSRHILPEYNIRERLRKTDHPTLIIASTDDVWPPESSLLLRNDMPHAQYLEISGGHFPMIEQSGIFWEMVFDFVFQ